MCAKLDLFLFLLGLITGTTQACRNGDRVAIDGSCKNYLECSAGELLTKSCSILHQFDSEKLECVWSWRAVCTDKSRECEENKLYPDPHNCRLYFDCRAGRLIQRFCFVGFVFDKSLGKCTFGYRCNQTDCVANERRVVPGDCKAYEQCSQGQWRHQTCGTLENYDAETQSCRLGRCNQCEEGDRKSGTACNVFHYCTEGIWKEDRCGLFRRFDPSKKKCVWWFQYSCPKPNRVIALGSECKEGELRSEEDCSKYSLCRSGQWTAVDCPENLLFDSVGKECVPRDRARCRGCAEDEADPASCNSYYTCEEGKKVKRSCGSLKQWDAASKSCAWSVPWRQCTRPNISPECEDGEKKTLSCEKYVECEYGVWVMKSCERGSTYVNGICEKKDCDVRVIDCSTYIVNGEKIECVPGEVYNERKRECAVGSCNSETTVSNICQDGEKQAVEGSCKKYKVCKSGVWEESSCSPCKNFNPENLSCQFAYIYHCVGPTSEPTPSSPSTPSSEPTPSSPSTPTSEPTSSPPTPTSEPIPCQENTVKPDPSDCKKYFQCLNGKFESKSCFLWKEFDVLTNTCVWYGAQCAA